MFSFLFIVSLGVVFADHLQNSTLHEPMESNVHGIVGGHFVDIEEYPYQVSILYSGKHYCGGCIISEKFVLTAAQCNLPPIVPESSNGMKDKENKYKKYKVRYGSRYSTHEGKIAEVNRILVHHKHPPVDDNVDESYIFDYDIAIVELSECLEFDAKCQPIRLPKGGQVIADGTFLTMSGFGATHYFDPERKFLRAAKSQKTNQDVCQEKYFEEIVITARMICVGYEGDSTYICHGDIGSPLVVGNTLVGIASLGYMNCLPGDAPVVYTNVASLRCWIRENAGV